MTRILCVLELSIHKAHDARFSALGVQYSTVHVVVADCDMGWLEHGSHMTLCAFVLCANVHTIRYRVEIQINLRVTILTEFVNATAPARCTK